MKRFYRAASTDQRDEGFVVLLDGKPVRTPARALLALPSEALASAIAEEWDRQDEEVDPETMPMMRHACTALDRVLPQRDAVADEVARFGATDLLCYRADEPETLVRRQDEAWQPWLDWLEESHGVRLATTTGIMPIDQDDAALQRLRKVVGTHDAFELTALHGAVSITASLVIGLALSVGRLDAATAWRLSRIDHDHQTARWGEDPEAAQVAAKSEAELNAAGRFLELVRR